MEVFLIYLYVVGAIATLLFFLQYFNPRSTSRVHGIIFLFRRYLMLPYLIKRRRLWGPLTRCQALLYCIYSAGTIAANVTKAPTLEVARARAGSLAVLHISLLCTVPSLSLGASFFRLSLPTYRRLHRNIGLMTVLQSVLHVLLSIQIRQMNLHQSNQRYGLIVS